MARKHECPDCGASHDMSAEGRIERLEARVRELEADRDAHRCDHHGCIHYWWNTPNTTYPSTDTNSTGKPSTTVSYDSTTAPQTTFTS